MKEITREQAKERERGKGQGQGQGGACNDCKT